MDLGLTGRVALVCGASKGLGRACAASLVREGARVAICARTKETLETTGRELGAEAIVADVARDADRERLVAETERRLGPVDILVNNAGGPPPGPFEAHSMETWRQAIETSFLSAVDLTRRVLPGMRARKRGRVISLTSYGALESIPGLMLSSSIRPAVLAWTRTTAREVGADGVGLVAVCQGLFLTDRMRKLIDVRARDQQVASEEALRRWVAEVPMGRMGDPAELGDLVAFLASPRAAYITGEAIAIDGGVLRRIL
ncbi:MAG: SDR family oxidoreductase [Deltaproteobacteria bacterium]|nr:SDR family oxidoreductase [Deltaproteobacteria bacterium]